MNSEQISFYAVLAVLTLLNLGVAWKKLLGDKITEREFDELKESVREVRDAVSAIEAAYVSRSDFDRYRDGVQFKLDKLDDKMSDLKSSQEAMHRNLKDDFSSTMAKLWEKFDQRIMTLMGVKRGVAGGDQT